MLRATVSSNSLPPIVCRTTKRRAGPNPNDRKRKSIAFTTPLHYASRLSEASRSRGFNPLWCPTIAVVSTPQTIIPYISSLENDFSAIAFTSRAGIEAFSEALKEYDDQCGPVSPDGDAAFTISALGRDADLLFHLDFPSKLCPLNPSRVHVLVPPLSTPAGMVESLGLGHGRRVLCPVPLLIGLDEPPVIPDFIRALTRNAWLPLKVCAYETRWSGPTALQDLLLQLQPSVSAGGLNLDALIFTSTAEVEGFLKSLRALGFEWGMFRAKCPRLVVAAHGPVTAAGALSLGVPVDVVSSNFASFDGVLDALLLRCPDNRSYN